MQASKPGIFAYWPNRITMLRFLGAAGLFTLLALEGHVAPGDVHARRGVFQLAFWLFLATSLSDILDGWLARRGNQVTAFGRIADPFVDKVLVMGLMVFLVVLPWSRDFFPAWIVVAILAREFLVTAIRGYVEQLGREFPADWFGKVKMLLQCFAIGIVMGLAAFDWPASLARLLEQAAHLCVWATLVTTLGSGLSYVAKTARILREMPR
ncbi:MAG TPA: CDP-diacylglycerol--glycerol-3-phosphate 3-phosphatidyltransferase [Planctomycetota bacterium]|nr:CDP-diacylglycerol--glycerol-3-phosphate 3-phosphatidyltransferase [Planctomycetota bacterium]